MSKNDFKKKVCKNENHFFFDFFLKFIFHIFKRYMITSLLSKKATETIRKKVKKSDFFGIFRDFSEIFIFFSDQMDNFWIIFHPIWTIEDNL